MPRRDPLRNFLFRLEIDGIQTAGFTPRTIREEDFAFNVSPKTASTILVPVGSQKLDHL